MMVDFLKALWEAITALTGTVPVYDGEAPEGSEMPYITYEITNDNKDFDRNNMVLQIDLWDNRTDRTALETLAHAVYKGLDAYTDTGTTYGFTCYALDRLTVPDPQETIKHKKLIFSVLAYIS